MPVLGGGGSGGTGTPSGGAANAVLRKNSAADGDAGWVVPATVDHAGVPAAALGAGTPGASVNAAAIDHVHPASGGGGSGGVDAHMAVIPATTASGNVFGVTASGANGSMSLNTSSWSVTVPIRVSASGTFNVGIEVTTAVASASVRIGVFAVAANGAPGALVFDTGLLSAATVGAKYSVASVTLLAGTRYLFSVVQEGGASSAAIRANPYLSEIVVGIASNNAYPANSFRMGAGPYANNPAVLAFDGDAQCPAFLLRVP